MKICSDCGEIKDESEFYAHRASGGIQSKCIECKRAYNRNHYQNNKQYYLNKAVEHSKKRIAAARVWVGDYLLTHPCVDCGEKDRDVLEFDHRDPALKLFPIADVFRQGLSITKIRLEIAKCDVRCGNCHRRRTKKQFGYFTYGPVA